MNAITPINHYQSIFWQNTAELRESLRDAVSRADFKEAIRLLELGVDPVIYIEPSQDLCEACPIISKIMNQEVAFFKDTKMLLIGIAIFSNQVDFMQAVLKSYQAKNLDFTSDNLYDRLMLCSHNCLLIPSEECDRNRGEIKDLECTSLELLAVYADCDQTLQILLDARSIESNFFLNEQGLVAAAIRSQSNRCVKVLIEQDPFAGTVTFDTGLTWILIASEWANFEALCLFLNRYIAAYYPYCNVHEIGRILASHKDLHGRNIFHYVALNNHVESSAKVEFIKKVLEKFPEMDINDADYEGATPLHVLQQNSWNDDIIEDVIALGADVSIVPYRF